MDNSVSSAAVGGSGRVGHVAPPPPSKLKTYGFVAAIILGVIGVTVGIAGAVSNVSQVDAIIMGAVGGGGGIILLITGIVGTVKNQQDGTIYVQPRRTVQELYADAYAALGMMVFGPRAWTTLGVTVKDLNRPKTPDGDIVKRGYSQTDKNKLVLIYIPHRINFRGRDQELTLRVMQEIAGVNISHFAPEVLEQFGDKSDRAGKWILIHKDVLETSRGVECGEMENRMMTVPSVLEVLAVNLMAKAIDPNQKLLGPDNYTYCREKIDGKPVAVRGFDQRRGLCVNKLDYVDENHGIAPIVQMYFT